MTARPLLLGIDDGTSAVKVIAYDLDLRPVAAATRPVPVSYPRPSWVEQDPEQVLEAVVDAVAAVLNDASGTVVACGIDHQGESVVAWDAVTGRALSAILVWQDKRSEALLGDLSRDDAQHIARMSGLPLDPYFSAGKMAWLLAEGGLANAPDVRLGTVDAYLCDRLGAGHATDPSTESRTQLSGVVGNGQSGWDARTLSALGIDPEHLPTILDSAGELGVLHHPRWRQDLPLRARVVDQQAALAGTGCVAPGQVKATYGTGAFVLAHVGHQPPAGGLSALGVLPTVAWRIAGHTEYALDGGVFTAGALLCWLSHDLGLAPDPAALMRLAGTVADTAGVRILPALSGLGAPWWRSDIRGAVTGLGLETTPAHIARSAIEAITWRVADIVAAMQIVASVATLRVDGGSSVEPLLRAIQADALGIPVEHMGPDATSVGAAGLAAVGAGVFATTRDIAERVRPLDRQEPRVDHATRAAGHAAWTRFVQHMTALPG